MVLGRRLLPPAGQSGPHHLRRSGSAGAALRRRESGARPLRGVHRALVSQHVAVRAQVAVASASRGVAVGDRDRDAAPHSSRTRRHCLPPPRALDRRARVRGRDAQGVQPVERRLTNGLVSAVIVTWNSAPFLRRCLAALAAQTYRDVELIHVDNASSDDSVAIVRDCATATHIINDTNRGFSAAVNQAVRIANGDFVLLLNPDAFLEPDYVSTLVAGLNDFGMA